MATLNLEPAISTRYRIERVMYRGRCGIETGSHTALQPIPRARLKVPLVASHYDFQQVAEGRIKHRTF